MNEKQKQLIESCLQLTFEYWRWQWEADLEEKMDNNFFDAFLQSTHESWLCSHSVASLGYLDSRPVRYFLRSDKWREWVSKSSKEWLMKAYEMIIDNFNK